MHNNYHTMVAMDYFCSALADKHEQRIAKQRSGINASVLFGSILAIDFYCSVGTRASAEIQIQILAKGHSYQISDTKSGLLKMARTLFNKFKFKACVSVGILTTPRNTGEGRKCQIPGRWRVFVSDRNVWSKQGSFVTKGAGGGYSSSDEKYHW